MDKTVLRVIFTVGALCVIAAGYLTKQTWLYIVAILIVVVGLAFILPKSK